MKIVHHDCMSQPNGMSAVHLAAENGHKAIVQSIMERFPGKDCVNLESKVSHA